MLDGLTFSRFFGLMNGYNLTQKWPSVNPKETDVPASPPWLRGLCYDFADIVGHRLAVQQRLICAMFFDGARHSSSSSHFSYTGSSEPRTCVYFSVSWRQ